MIICLPTLKILYILFPSIKLNEFSLFHRALQKTCKEVSDCDQRRGQTEVSPKTVLNKIKGSSFRILLSMHNEVQLSKIKVTAGLMVFQHHESICIVSKNRRPVMHWGQPCTQRVAGIWNCWKKLKQREIIFREKARLGATSWQKFVIIWGKTVDDIFQKHLYLAGLLHDKV